jgi:hypothetical protein
MKKLGIIIALTLITIVAVVDLFYEFVTNEPVHYFVPQSVVS